MRGNRRTNSEVAANRAAVLALIADGQMSATEAAHRLGIPERTARRLVGKARPPKVKPQFLPIEQCKPTPEEEQRRREREIHMKNMQDNESRPGLKGFVDRLMKMNVTLRTRPIWMSRLDPEGDPELESTVNTEI